MGSVHILEYGDCHERRSPSAMLTRRRCMRARDRQIEIYQFANKRTVFLREHEVTDADIAMEDIFLV